jgi:peptide/nickel transport system permease protein
VLTGFPASMTRALGGVVIVEVVFNWPGIGNLLVRSVLFQDFPVIQAVFILIAVWVILGNYLVDILYTVIDPRITLSGSN